LSSLLFDMARLTTIATTSNDCHYNATLCLENKPLFHISNLFHIRCLYPIYNNTDSNIELSYYIVYIAVL